jgi:hypothetical protein
MRSILCFASATGSFFRGAKVRRVELVNRGKSGTAVTAPRNWTDEDARRLAAEMETDAAVHSGTR